MDNTVRSLERKLNELIDHETEKELEADVPLILACCDGLLRLDDVSRYTLSAQVYREKLDEIIGVSDKTSQRRKTIKVILIAAIIAALLAAAALGYAQVKYDLFHFSDHSVVAFSHDNNKEVKDMLVGYVPEGFTLAKETRKENSIAQDFVKGEFHFSMVKGSIIGEISINTEYGKSKTVSINGVDYIVYGEETHDRGVLWSVNDYSYNLLGNLEEEEMLKIAVSVR